MTKTFTLAALLLSTAAPAFADGELNLYSSRHYDTDERLYSDFEDATGITINRIEGKADELAARMMAEGVNSPADILITVDTSRLERAKDMGLLQSIDSEVLEGAIPDNLQDTDNQWFGFSQRARVIFYDKADVANPPMTYLDLADPAYAGLVCIRSSTNTYNQRSSTNTYNQTLLASIIENHGEDTARTWAQGVVDNMARAPQGGDTDQLRGIVSGECEISVSNTYYFARALRRDVDGLSDSIDMIGLQWPSQDAEGAHVNLSGAGVAANAPNRDNAIAFLEYLASDQAQQYFSAGNDEFPAVVGTQLSAEVASLGDFTADNVSLSAVAKQLPLALEIFNDVGWE